MSNPSNSLTHRIHISWLVAIASFGVVAGIALAGYNPLYLSAIQYVIIATCLATISFTKRTPMAIPLLFIAGCAIGLWRGEVIQIQLHDYESYIGKSVYVSGRVSEDTTTGISGNQHIRLRDVRINGVPMPGEVWISTDSHIEIKRSDMMQVSGLLSEGFGSLPASVPGADIISIKRPAFGDVPREVRDWFAGGVRAVIREPEASLGVGYLLGQRSTLPKELDDNLRLLGLTHVVVASGYNLTILVRFARASFARFSKYIATASASTMIISFFLVTGASPSMSRAALVAGLSLMAWYLGRNLHPLVLLPIAASITGMIQPQFIWGDLGWYLSFASFAGIMIFAPLVQHYFWGVHNPPGAIRRIVIETLSAQLLTLPLIAFMFGQYSPLALPANILILPLIPLTMLFTFIAGIAGVISLPLAWIIATPASWSLQYMTLMIDKLSLSPFASGEISIGLLGLIGGYVVLIISIIFMWWQTKHSFRNDNIVV